MQLLNALKSNASRSTTPTDSLGWGVPNMCYASGIGVLSVAQLSKEDQNIHLFPNPVSQQLSVTMKDAEVLGSKVTDVLGKEITCETEKQNEGHLMLVNTSQLPSGIYFITLNSSKGILTKKFVKQ